MTLLRIALKDILILLKDKKALATLIATPLVLTLILGLSLGSLWNSSTPPSLLYYLNEDEGTLGRLLFDEVFALPELAERFNLKETTSAAEAREQVQKGKAAALIHIPADFSNEAAAGGKTSIELFTDPGSHVRAQIVASVAERFAAEVSSRQVVFQTLAKTAAAQQLLLSPPDLSRVDEVLASIKINAAYYQGFTAEPSVSDPRAMDYYAAGTGVMYLLFTVNYGANLLLQERRHKTLARMLTAPVSRLRIIGGKVLGIFLMGLLQFSLIIAASHFFFKVNWGNPIGAALLTCGAVLAAAGLSLFIAAASKTAESASAFSTFMVLSMAALGGSMFPTFAMPAWMQSLTKVTINGWAIEGFLKLMFDGAGPVDILPQTIVLAAAGIIFCLLASRRLFRKVE